VAHKPSKINKHISVDDEDDLKLGRIGKERKTNYTLEPRTLEEFIEFMKQP
jgi:hypothetical protein